ncbi:MAG TPA: alpha/beta hydrolase, partial [Candidatus Binatia bacterium]|nr:alpha/beta hydrolase [Candidatus Binatia bacterium]
RDSSEILSDFPPPAADARIAYGDEPLQFGDLRLPAGDGPHPLVVVIHGGYWKATTNLTHLGHACAALAREGIATWSLEYRRIGDVGGGWPGTFDDVARALDHVPSLPLDVDRVVLFGHSAGGHLALWSAEAVPVVAAAPVTDLEATWRRNPQVVEGLLGGAPADVPDRSTAATPRSAPTQTVIHGTADDVVPFEDSVAYARHPVRLVPLEGAGHFEPVDPQAREWPVVVAELRRALALA